MPRGPKGERRVAPAVLHQPHTSFSLLCQGEMLSKF